MTSSIEESMTSSSVNEPPKSHFGSHAGVGQTFFLIQFICLYVNRGLRVTNVRMKNFICTFSLLGFNVRLYIIAAQNFIRYLARPVKRGSGRQSCQVINRVESSKNVRTGGGCNGKCEKREKRESLAAFLSCPRPTSGSPISHPLL